MAEQTVVSATTIPLPIEEAIGRLRDRAASLGIRLSRPVARSPWSVVFRGSGGGYPGDVAVKMCLDAPNGCVSGPEAVAAHESLQRARSGGWRGAPRPLAVFPHLGSFIMDWVDGPTVAKSLIRSGFPEACLVAREAGAWLAKLHRVEVETGALAPLDADAVLDRIRIEISENKGGAATPIVSRAVDLLAATASMAAASATRWVTLHGDFKPKNLILSAGQIVGFDFALTVRDSGLVDAAHFLNRVDLLARGPITLSRSASDRHRRIGAAFCNGYAAGEIAEINYDALNWLRLQNAVRLFLRHAASTRLKCLQVRAYPIRLLVESLCREIVSRHRHLGGVLEWPNGRTWFWIH